MLAALLLAGLAALVAVLFAAGIHKNAQITQLRQHGVVVDMTVSGCLGMLGGSGSNAAGYHCRGNFTLDGRRYDEALPGAAFYPPGARVRAVTVPGDPALLSTVGAVKTQRASAGVFVVPSVLSLALVLLSGILIARCRRAGSTGREVSSSATSA